ncbi:MULTISPECIES: pentapeptide repeat-containing protein [unclassified Pseudovibrio]|uniref:pentapeptide repeat-containing protein n=1 Tax=unclassified Pseudovibrio TaxID=2627060 RepID=UPI0007AE6FF8|nr:MULTISPECIES: pentapeptide repeat-containing protein [unclassified Pseudovibrio]KZL02288.1 hypothetical protein PsW74_01386 [Pseudovibrio sp. W74]KZL08168.1 hypothetical protein PsAD14_03315 [Pseudovibrio sp. Ad14]
MALEKDKPVVKGITISYRTLGKVACLIFLATAILAIGFWPDIMSLKFWGGSDPAFGDIFRNIGWILVGAIGLVLAYERTNTASRQADISNDQAVIANEQAKTANKQAETAMENLKLAEKGHNLDRFEKSAALMGKEDYPSRLAGLTLMFELAKEHPKEYYLLAQKQFCALIQLTGREVSQIKKRNDDVSEKNMSSEDHLEIHAAKRLGQEALTYFSKLRIDHIKLEEYWTPEMIGAQFSELEDIDVKLQLQGVNLSHASFNKSKIVMGNFRAAILYNCSVEEATFYKCDFSHARLREIIQFKNTCRTTGSTFKGAFFSTNNPRAMSYSFSCFFQEASTKGLCIAEKDIRYIDQEHQGTVTICDENGKPKHFKPA